MTDLIELGQLIRAARKEKGLNQTELGKEADVARSTINMIENGRAPEAGIKMILKIMHTLGLDLHPGTYNAGRPTVETLQREETEMDDAPRLGR